MKGRSQSGVDERRLLIKNSVAEDMIQTALIIVTKYGQICRGGGNVVRPKTRIGVWLEYSYSMDSGVQSGWWVIVLFRKTLRFQFCLLFWFFVYTVYTQLV